MDRLEQVDLSLIRSLTQSHSKTVKEFLYLELGIKKPRHILTIRRMMYHYHLITREDCEIIKKVYLKQKESSVKGGWITTLSKDFDFINQKQNDEEIIKRGKSEYFSHIKSKVKHAAFSLYITLHNIGLNPLPQVKLGKKLICRFLVCVFDKNKGRS